MATESLKTGNVNLKLNGGVHATTGNMIVKACGLGKVLPDADKDKIMDVIKKLLPCLAFPIVRVERTILNIIEN